MPITVERALIAHLLVYRAPRVHKALKARQVLRDLHCGHHQKVHQVSKLQFLF